MNLDLGGPGVACSAMRVRRLLAGELTGAEKERTLAHLESCERCAATQREIAAENEQLRRDVPFPQFAAGVAEKLAQRPQRQASRWVPLALAAGLALVAGVQVARAPDDSGVRSKGGASAQLFVQDAKGVRELSSLEPVTTHARLLVNMQPAQHKYASVLLIEPGETSVVYSGLAVKGSLPQAFEWTGSGKATLKVWFADRPFDPMNPPRDADVIEIPLHR